jgi:hypothetical protein
MDGDVHVVAQQQSSGSSSASGSAASGSATFAAPINEPDEGSAGPEELLTELTNLQAKIGLPTAAQLAAMSFTDLLLQPWDGIDVRSDLLDPSLEGQARIPPPPPRDSMHRRPQHVQAVGSGGIAAAASGIGAAGSDMQGMVAAAGMQGMVAAAGMQGMVAAAGMQGMVAAAGMQGMVTAAGMVTTGAQALPAQGQFAHQRGLFAQAQPQPMLMGTAGAPQLLQLQNLAAAQGLPLQFPHAGCFAHPPNM